MDAIKLASAILRKVAVDLSADDSYYEIDGDRHYRNDIDALADRLTALQAEPTAWLIEELPRGFSSARGLARFAQAHEPKPQEGYKVTPLYPAPPAPVVSDELKAILPDLLMDLEFLVALTGNSYESRSIAVSKRLQVFRAFLREQGVE